MNESGEILNVMNLLPSDKRNDADPERRAKFVLEFLLHELVKFKKQEQEAPVGAIAEGIAVDGAFLALPEKRGAGPVQLTALDGERQQPVMGVRLDGGGGEVASFHK